MTEEQVRYIMVYFRQFFTETERRAVRHTFSTEKLEHNNNPNFKSVYERNGWLTSDQGALDLLKNGYDSFALNTANRIVAENGDIVIFNNCPECGKLARTPTAKQCRHCGHDWH
jgi:hypothetical protein